MTWSGAAFFCSLITFHSTPSILYFGHNGYLTATLSHLVQRISLPGESPPPGSPHGLGFSSLPFETHLRCYLPWEIFPAPNSEFPWLVWFHKLPASFHRIIAHPALKPDPEAMSGSCKCLAIASVENGDHKWFKYCSLVWITQEFQVICLLISCIWQQLVCSVGCHLTAVLITGTLLFWFKDLSVFWTWKILPWNTQPKTPLRPKAKWMSLLAASIFLKSTPFSAHMPTTQCSQTRRVFFK